MCMMDFAPVCCESKVDLIFNAVLFSATVHFVMLEAAMLSLLDKVQSSVIHNLCLV